MSETSSKEDVIDSSKGSTSSRQRTSDVYQYFTFNELTLRWYCAYCS
jgi:hypothetical protein